MIVNQLEFQNGGTTFVYPNRPLNDLALISQLKNLFSSKLKTHVYVLVEIIEKIHKLKCSSVMIEEILDLASK